MSKTIEIPDIAMWEETDSELAKYKIQALNGLVNSYKRQNEYLEASIKHIEQVNKDLYERIDKAKNFIENIKVYDENLNIIDIKFGIVDRIYNILRGEE